MDAFYGRKVRLQALEAVSHLHIALFFLIFSLLYPSPLILGPSVESDRGRGDGHLGRREKLFQKCPVTTAEEDACCGLNDDAGLSGI